MKYTTDPNYFHAVSKKAAVQNFNSWGSSIILVLRLIQDFNIR
jgi:hypothetical protein